MECQKDYLIVKHADVEMKDMDQEKDYIVQELRMLKLMQLFKLLNMVIPLRIP
ncbi:hypothetical protein D3C71_2148480 [compost metagenome]